MRKVLTSLTCLIMLATILLSQEVITARRRSAGASTNTFTAVQRPTGNVTCSTVSTSCAITVTSTGAGHVGVVTVMYVDSSQRTISSISGGGTYTRDATGCPTWNGTSTLGVECAYTLNSTSGATTVTVTMSAAPAVFWAAFYREYSFTPGPVSLDTSGSAQRATSATPTGVTLTLSGTSDAILQFVMPNDCISAVSSPYDTNASFDGCLGIADRLNTAIGTGPTWTQNNPDPSAVAAIAFK